MGKRLRITELQGDCVRTKPYRVEDKDGNYAMVNPNTPTENIGAGQGTGGGTRPIYDTVEDFIDALNSYVADIVQSGYEKLPTKTDFAFCNNIHPATVYRYFDKMSETQKREWSTTLSDIITAGVNAGKYNTTMSIFALKNWCNWADKNEQKVETSTKQLVSKQEAKDQLRKYSEGLKLAK